MLKNTIDKVQKVCYYLVELKRVRFKFKIWKEALSDGNVRTRSDKRLRSIQVI